ncbi:hypothetical protein NKH74_33960 [Mesorhizobium sp. M0933]|uniref:hypothetical protein n=1 Tax=Mesorhizobium sp. M0933 TaxID=2957030 RepID=UPI00333CD673
MTSDKSYQIDSCIALNKAIGGQAGSPFAEQESHKGLDRSAASQSVWQAHPNIQRRMLAVINGETELFLTNAPT